MSFRHVAISTLTVACILGGISAHGADYNYVKIAKLAAHAGRYDQDQIAISGYVFESTLERYWRDGDAFVTWNLVLSDDVTLDRGSATALCYESGYNGDIIEKAAQISRMEKHLGHQVTVVGIFNSSREILNMRRLIYSDAEGELHDIDTDLGDYVLSDYQRHYDWDTYNWDTYDYDIHYTVWYGHCHIWPRPYWWGWYEPVYIVRIPVVDRRTVVYHYTPHVRPPRGRVYAHTPVLYDDRVPTRAIRLNPRTLPQPRGSGHPTCRVDRTQLEDRRPAVAPHPQVTAVLGAHHRPQPVAALRAFRAVVDRRLLVGLREPVRRCARAVAAFEARRLQVVRCRRHESHHHHRPAAVVDPAPVAADDDRSSDSRYTASGDVICP